MTLRPSLVSFARVRPRLFKAIAFAAVWALPLAFGVVLTDHAETQTGPREAPTGFDNRSNGFAEEFCANQGGLATSPNSPRIPADECSFATSVTEFTGPEAEADGLGMCGVGELAFLGWVEV